jgi:hypothetical protein
MAEARLTDICPKNTFQWYHWVFIFWCLGFASYMNEPTKEFLKCFCSEMQNSSVCHSIKKQFVENELLHANLQVIQDVFS